MHSPEIASSPATAEALVRAARRLFTQHGYDGASVRAITAEAGANLGAITYHFGSKRALYEQVVEDCIRPLADRVEAAARGEGAPLERVEAVVRAYFAFFASHPDVPQLMLQELAVGRTLPEAAIAQMRRINGALAELVREGQADGSIRQGNAVLMAISTISNPIHLNLVRRPLKALMGLDLADPATRAVVVESAVAFARGGLAAPPDR